MSLVKRVTSSLQNIRRHMGLMFNWEDVPVFSVLILGEPNVGKYALFNAMTKKNPQEEKGTRPQQITETLHHPGLSSKIFKIQVKQLETSKYVHDDNDDDLISTLSLKYIDTSKKIHKNTKKTAIKGADAYILCFSLADQRSLTALESHLDILRESTNMNFKSIILVGCQADIEPHEVTRRDIDRMGEMIKQRGWSCKYIETSAFTNQNVGELENTIVNQIKERRIDRMMRG